MSKHIPQEEHPLNAPTNEEQDEVIAEQPGTRSAGGGAAPARAAGATPEQIAERAHEFWIDEGRPDGQAVQHWKRAERELNNPNPSS